MRHVLLTATPRVHNLTESRESRRRARLDAPTACDSQAKLGPLCRTQPTPPRRLSQSRSRLLSCVTLDHSIDAPAGRRMGLLFHGGRQNARDIGARNYFGLNGTILSCSLAYPGMRYVGLTSTHANLR